MATLRCFVSLLPVSVTTIKPHIVSDYYWCSSGWLSTSKLCRCLISVCVLSVLVAWLSLCAKYQFSM